MTKLEKLTTALLLGGVALLFAGADLAVEQEQLSGVWIALLGAAMASAGTIIDNNL